MVLPGGYGQRAECLVWWVSEHLLFLTGSPLGIAPRSWGEEGKLQVLSIHQPRAPKCKAGSAGVLR